MAFSNNIPQPTDRLSKSQQDLLANNTTLDAVYGVNHYDFSSAVEVGKHKHCTFPEQAADPTTIDNEIALFAKEFDTETELFYVPEGGLTPAVQLTDKGYPASFIKAFVYFDATGAIQGNAYNVASVVKFATGQYTVTFTSALPDVNYVILFGGFTSRVTTYTARAVGSFNVGIFDVTGVLRDAPCNVAVLRI